MNQFLLSNIQKSKCSICQEFANIHCINCKDYIWLCVDHWCNIKQINIIDEMGYFAFLAGNVILSTEWSFTLIISL